MSLPSTGTPPPTSPTSPSSRYSHSPYAMEVLGDADLWLTDVVVHRQLAGTLRFIRYDAMAETPLPPSTVPPNAATAASSLFLGQVRYEMTAGLIATLLRRLVKVTVQRVDPRPKGCFVITLGNAEEAQRVRSLHKRLLFDNIGVWIADESQSPFLVEYVLHVGRHLAGSSRLPHDCMVVEECRIPQINTTRNSMDAATVAHDKRRNVRFSCTSSPQMDDGVGIPSHSASRVGPMRARPPPYGAEHRSPLLVPVQQEA